MFNVYDMLKSGMSAEEIAAVFTQNLNDAETKVKAEEAEEARLAEEAARAEQERIDAKQQDFEEAVGDLLCAIARHYPELGIEIEDITSESVAAITGLIFMLLDLEALKSRKPKVKVEVKPTEVDPFAAFFKQFGL